MEAHLKTARLCSTILTALAVFASAGGLFLEGLCRDNLTKR